MNEFTCIRKYLSPLCGGHFTEDDAAEVHSPGGVFTVTKDMLIEGVHFLKNSDSKLLAKKALRVNLSDIAAMGAIPHSYLLGLSLPRNTTDAWWENFSAGLDDDNRLFNVKLVGGDTTTNNANIVIVSITAMGVPSTNGTLKRSGAKVGDLVYVSETIGDAALGLLVCKNLIQKGDLQFLRSRYSVPVPRVELGTLMCGIVSACTDVSDGLIQDIENICRLSGVGASIYVDRVPLSEESSVLLNEYPHLLETVLTGGDDYELVFTVAPEKRPLIEQAACNTCVRISEIGQIRSMPGVDVYNSRNEKMSLRIKGYKHEFG